LIESGRQAAPAPRWISGGFGDRTLNRIFDPTRDSVGASRSCGSLPSDVATATTS